MGFKKMSVPSYPPRQWALVGHPASGKSTFAAQLRGPLLAIDADHRFAEVIHLAAGDVYQLSDNLADNINPRQIHALLQGQMCESTIGTIIIDSLTSIIAPIVTDAQLAKEDGENKKWVTAFMAPLGGRCPAAADRSCG